MIKFPFYSQLESKDCGPACLKMIAQFHGAQYSIEYLRKLSQTSRSGSNLGGLANAAETIGLRSIGAKINLNQLIEIKLPVICHWNKNHFVVLYKIRKDIFFVADPALGKISCDKRDFKEAWATELEKNNNFSGIILSLEPTSQFFENAGYTEESDGNRKFLFHYYKVYKAFFWQLALGIVLGSFLQVILPFLMQSIVDVGIRNRDIPFIYLILTAQLFVFAGKSMVEYIRRWILMHLGTRINVTLLSDFLIKIMKLPIAFFDTRMTGDLLRRMNDHYKIERLLTVSSLDIVFSSFNLILLGIVLAYFNLKIFLIFFIGTAIHFCWIMLFMKRRAILDNRRFIEEAKDQSKMIELIHGMAEIKLHNAERYKRWEWEEIQARLFKLDIKELKLEQNQVIGAGFLNELKNILIIAVASILVIDGGITLGVLLAISFIIGQLNAPVSKMVSFLQELQDAKQAIERLNEIHGKENESGGKIRNFDKIASGDIKISQVSFINEGQQNMVLKNICMVIPYKKVTAIVGPSGCGKTTLLKLLLKFYDPSAGCIQMGDIDLKLLSPHAWRDYCGAVLQEGYLFNDTILGNIVMGSENIDFAKLATVVKTSNLESFISSLPFGYETKVGSEGFGLSTGQKQRILIARAIYKSPELMIFDEATSALDAHNERVISDNLSRFLENKTVIIAAHRLNTIINADQVVVLREGTIAETGTHETLYRKKGYYYDLIKNQIEFTG